MKKFIVHFILISLFVIAASLFYHLKIEKMNSLWLLYSVSLDFIFILPVTSAISILWPQIIRDSSGQGASGVQVIFYVFVVIGFAFLFQELAIPKLYESINYRANLKAMGIKKVPYIQDSSGDRITSKEFESLVLMPNKEDIAFSMGNSYLYFRKMYNGNGAYYAAGFRMIAYNSKRQLDYILTSDYAKISGTEINLINPLFMQYGPEGLRSSKRISGVKKIPLIYDANGIYGLSSEATAKVASLIDIFLNSEYVYGSKINFFHLGNILFNKIGYYLSLVLILILASSFGSAYKNSRPLSKEIFQTACFYVLSFFFITLIYDTFVSVINLIYGMMI